MSEQQPVILLELTAQIVTAHVSANSVASDALPSLIEAVYRSLASVEDQSLDEPAKPAPVPAVPVRKSVFPDYIVCLEDGKKLKMLKRHLRVSYGLSPADYRAKWGLPRDYPMVAPNYTSHRSSLAKSIGLGRRNSEGETSPEAETDIISDENNIAEPEVTQLPKRRAKGSRG